MSKPLGYLRLIRPTNCLMMGFAVVVGAAIANADTLGASWISLLYGFITGFVLAAASMSINDYFDRAIDAVNEPQRPIPSGLIRPEAALTLAFILTAIGFAAAYLTNGLLTFLTATIAWLAFIAYTLVGKRSGLPGNFLVSICVAIPFIYGNFAVATTLGLNVLTFASMAFLSNTGREITKGIADVKGDKTQNVETLAVRFGEKNAALAATAFYLLAVLLTPIPVFLRLVTVWFIPFVAITDIGLAASSFLLLRDCSRENAKKIKKTVLVWFMFGLFAFVFGVVK